MGLGFKRTLTTSDVPVFQGDGRDVQIAQGGFLLDISGLPAGSTVKAGSVMTFDESTRVAKVLPAVKVIEDAGGSATQYKVDKGSLFQVGDPIFFTNGGKAYAITSIDVSGNSSYDTITVGTSIGAVPAGGTIFKSAATGATTGAFSATPKGLLWSDTKVEAGESVSVAIRATVYARRVPYSTALEAALPHIIYSQSF